MEREFSKRVHKLKTCCHRSNWDTDRENEAFLSEETDTSGQHNKIKNSQTLFASNKFHEITKSESTVVQEKLKKFSIWLL